MGDKTMYKELKQSGKKIKSIDSLSGKCQKRLIRIKLGNGYSNVI